MVTAESRSALAVNRGRPVRVVPTAVLPNALTVLVVRIVQTNRTRATGAERAAVRGRSLTSRRSQVLRGLQGARLVVPRSAEMGRGRAPPT